ncbi:unnamed protein product [Cochlearia groenlandica]
MDDEKLWKVFKKDHILTRSFSTNNTSSSSSSSSSTTTKPIFTRSFSTKHTSCTSSSELIFRRSFSAKPTPLKSSFLSRNCSKKCADESSYASKCSISRSLSQKGVSVTRKCRDKAKEHKSRFYIMKRCVWMLVCWHKHA